MNQELMNTRELFDLFEAGEREGGVCVYCREQTPYAEPDAQKYTCDQCGKPGVYGLEELYLRNHGRFCTMSETKGPRPDILRRLVSAQDEIDATHAQLQMAEARARDYPDAETADDYKRAQAAYLAAKAAKAAIR